MPNEYNTAPILVEGKRIQLLSTKFEVLSVPVNMKPLIVFFLAVWLQLPSYGVGRRIARTDFSLFNNRRSILVTSEECVELTASDAVKDGLHNMFSEPTWRKLILLIASPEAMADPDFRDKWNVTDDDVRKKEYDEDNMPPKLVEQLKWFSESRRWKALLALNSTRNELVNPDYREVWGLKNLPMEEIAAADEDWDFFRGPQWLAWLNISNEDVAEDTDNWEKAHILMMWIRDIGREIMAMEDEILRIENGK